MADFDRAYTRTLLFEGGFGFAPGEVYCGVDRRWHPEWNGWLLLDKCKVEGKMVPGKLRSMTPRLEPLLRAFYRDEYWDVIGGDTIPDQLVANEVYDAAVMSGPEDGVKFLQAALNGFGASLKVDGDNGKKTRAALSTILGEHASMRLVTAQKGYRIVHCCEAPGRAKFVGGWMTRIASS